VLLLAFPAYSLLRLPTKLSAFVFAQVVVFLQLTDFVNEDDRQEHAPPACANEALRNRPGPTPATVKPIYHNTGSHHKGPHGPIISCRLCEGRWLAGPWFPFS
jgi:hypothetical protein